MFVKTEKQKQAIRLMSQYTELLLEGGSRSGKTFVSIAAILIRALKYPNTRHLITRKHFNHIKSITTQTLPDVIEKVFDNGINYELNKTDFIVTIDNGSMIYFVGTEDKDRLEKVLGYEFATIFMNEASQNNYEVYETLKTRLNPPEGVKPLFLIDYNPPSKTHWGYCIFHLGIDPTTKQPLINKDRYARIQMNPGDNINNLSESYLETLESMSEKRKQRFLYGMYGDDSENALWKRDWIVNNRVNKIPDNLEKIIVAVDPAVTGNDTSDDTGIIVVGKKKEDGKEIYYVLADYTVHGDVSGWGKEVVRAYQTFQADCVVGEVNQGGDLVEMNIRNYDRHIKFKSVRATRGKIKRAEPIADLYERNLVKHCGIFTDLEDQMCTWTPESQESPDNMDALVWGLAYLAEIYKSNWQVLTW